MAYGAVDLSKLGEFEFDTQIGRLKGRTPTMRVLGDIEGRFPDLEKADPTELTSFLLRLVSRRLAGGDELSDSDLSALTKEDLDRFAQRFLENNKWLYQDLQDNGKPLLSPQDAGEDVKLYLRRVLSGYFERAQERLGALMGRGSIHQKALSERMRTLLAQNEALSRSLGNTLHSTYVEEFTKSALRQPTAAYEAPSITVPPPNPVYETNERLGILVSQLQEMAPTVSKTAALIKNMNDLGLSMATALAADTERTARFNKTMLSVAAITLFFTAVGAVTTAVFSVLSYTRADWGVQNANKVPAHEVQPKATAAAKSPQSSKKEFPREPAKLDSKGK